MRNFLKIILIFVLLNFMQGQECSVWKGKVTVNISFSQIPLKVGKKALMDVVIRSYLIENGEFAVMEKAKLTIKLSPEINFDNLIVPPMQTDQLGRMGRLEENGSRAVFELRDIRGLAFVRSEIFPQREGTAIIEYELSWRYGNQDCIQKGKAEVEVVSPLGLSVTKDLTILKQEIKNLSREIHAFKEKMRRTIEILSSVPIVLDEAKEQMSEKKTKKIKLKKIKGRISIDLVKKSQYLETEHNKKLILKKCIIINNSIKQLKFLFLKRKNKWKVECEEGGKIYEIKFKINSKLLFERQKELLKIF